MDDSCDCRAVTEGVPGFVRQYLNVPRDHLHGECVGAIGSSVAHDAQVHADQLAILVDTAAIAQDLWVACAGASKFLCTRKFKPYRAPGLNGQMCTQIFKEHLLFAAKAATNTWFDNADPPHRYSNQWCNHASHMEGHLGAGANHQPVIFIPPGQDHVRFDAGLLNLVYAVLAFINGMGLGQGSIDITMVHVDVDGDVVVSIMDVYCICFVMNDGRILFTRWDYGVNKNVFNRHALWTQNPDGTGMDLFFGNTVIDPRSLCRGRQVPGRPDYRKPERYAFQFYEDQITRLKKLRQVLNMAKDPEDRNEIRLSDLVREAIDGYLDRQTQANEPYGTTNA